MGGGGNARTAALSIATITGVLLTGAGALGRAWQPRSAGSGVDTGICRWFELAVTPLFYDIQNLTVVTGQQIANAGDAAPVPADVFKYFRAAAYMDVAVLERLFATLPPIARRPFLLPLLDAERRAALLKAPWNWRGTLARLWKFEVRKGRSFGLARNHRFLAAAWPEFLSTAGTLCDVELPTLTDAKLDEHLTKVWQLAISVAPQCEVAVLYYAQDLRLFLPGYQRARAIVLGDPRCAEVALPGLRTVSRSARRMQSGHCLEPCELWVR